MKKNINPFFFISVSLLWTTISLHTTTGSTFPDIPTPWAHKTVNSLSLEEKIGQLFMVAATSDPDGNDILMANSSVYTKDQDYIEYLISEYHVGGIIFLGNGKQPEKQTTLTQHYQNVNKAFSTIPLLIGQDCEWGLSMRLKNTVRFPRNMTLGALSKDNDSLIYEMGKEVGRQCKVIGVHINFAPVVDVNNNPNNPVINDRSFGENKEAVAHKGTLFMRGLQDTGVIACAKHFIGHGDTDTDSHLDLPCIPHTLERIHDTELYPFKHLIREGVQSIMIAHLEVPVLEPTANLPSTLSYNIVTNLLKKELGFHGLVITDGLGMRGVTKHHQPGEIELKALLAGNDILLCPLDVPKATNLIKQALKDGRLSAQELDQHVLKILRAKEWVFSNQASPQSKSILEQLNTKYAYQLKKKLYQNAITVVRDPKNLLPLTNSTPAPFVQIGGTFPSTYEQTLKKHPLSRTYYLPAYASEKSVTELLNKLHADSTVIVGIYAMNKYIDQQFGVSDKTLDFINALCEQHKNVILTIFGSPYSIDLFNRTTTLIVAYEDEHDAQVAAAHVILGRLTPRGKLPVSPCSDH